MSCTTRSEKSMRRRLRVEYRNMSMDARMVMTQYATYWWDRFRTGKENSKVFREFDSRQQVRETVTDRKWLFKTRVEICWKFVYPKLFAMGMPPKFAHRVVIKFPIGGGFTWGYPAVVR